jgi:hypothetical protein
MSSIQYLIFPVKGISFVSDLGAEIRHSMGEPTVNWHRLFMLIPLELKLKSSTSTALPETSLILNWMYFRYISGTTYLSSLRLFLIDQPATLLYSSISRPYLKG